MTSRFLTDCPRQHAVPLDWPVEVNGVSYTEIVCRRVTAGELDAFYDLPAGQRLQLPTIDAPAEIIAALDADDADRVREVALGFLPRSLRTDASPTPPTSA